LIAGFIVAATLSRSRVLTVQDRAPTSGAINQWMEAHMRIASIVLALVIGIAAPAAAQTDSVRPLVDAEWLVANAGDENVEILDIRDNIEGTDLGDAPYIEGAPPVEEVVGFIGSLGIDNDEHVDPSRPVD
jgi:hypothetical protein